jgi:hypothetical protein
MSLFSILENIVDLLIGPMGLLGGRKLDPPREDLAIFLDGFGREFQRSGLVRVNDRAFRLGAAVLEGEDEGVSEGDDSGNKMRATSGRTPIPVPTDRPWTFWVHSTSGEDRDRLRALFERYASDHLEQ